MNALNRKDQQLRIKYKKKANTCNIKRNACKFSEDQDDLRIYGMLSLTQATPTRILLNILDNKKNLFHQLSRILPREKHMNISPNPARWPADPKQPKQSAGLKIPIYIQKLISQIIAPTIQSPQTVQTSPTEKKILSILTCSQKRTKSLETKK